MPSKGPATRSRSVDSTMAFTDVGPVRIAKIHASQRGSAFELKPNHPVHRYLNVALQLGGISTCTQQRRTAKLDASHWAAFEVGQLNVLSSTSGCELLVLLIPQDQLEADLDIKRISARPLPASVGASRLLRHTAICMIEELPRMDLRRADSLAQAICRLVSLAIHERLGAEAPAISTRMDARDRIQHYIANHLRDPHFSLDQIARHLNCTKRYLHKVFQGNDVSLGEYILQQRLERCRTDLSDPTLLHLSITEVALSWGFNSVSHFSRAFRARFKQSPRAVRLGTQTRS